MNSVTDSLNPEEPKPMPWRVVPVGRAMGRRLGGVSSAIARREGYTAEEYARLPKLGRRGKAAMQHHADHSVDPWEGMIS